MNKTFYIIYVLIAMITSVSCNNDNNKASLDLSGDVDIHSFSINGIQGIINPDNSTITVIMPSTTDLTALAPQITLGIGAKVSPASGEIIDFRNQQKGSEVIYTVTNADVYQRYKVIVDVVRAKLLNSVSELWKVKLTRRQKPLPFISHWHRHFSIDPHC